MRFSTTNDLQLFNFEQVTIQKIQLHSEQLTLVMDAVICKGKHPDNEEFVDRFVDTASLRFLEARITDFFKEGYKYYDANDVLQKEEPDTPISVLEYETVLKKMEEAYLFDIIRVESVIPSVADVPKSTPVTDTASVTGNTVDAPQTPVFTYQLGIDVEEDTYWITLTCEKTILEWERFMNRVQS